MRVAIGLGSNMGDRLALLRSAVVELRQLGEVVAVSSLYRSDPVGGPDQPDFLNAAVVVETELSLTEVLAGCLLIEQEADRVRTERWGPRTLDLDILSASSEPVSSEELTVPHQRLSERRFALDPLAEIWADAATGNGPAQAAAQAVKDQKVEALADPSWVAELSKGGGWVLAQVALLTWVVGGAWPFEPSASQVGRWLGGLVGLAGLVLAIAAIRSLGKNLTPYPEPVAGAELVAVGPYGMVRHPIYGGIIIGLGGLALYQGSFTTLLGAIEMGALFWLKSSFEERRLLIAHPTYRRYQQTVRKRLLPFVL